MVTRDMETRVRQLSRQFPVVVVLGPRQSGKTTLCRSVFADKPYVSLEDPDTRRFAFSDPRGFLAQYPQGAVLDEVQRAPELPSYLQTIVDAQRKRGLFVLTGSENFSLTASVTQSLAGRAGIVTLLPLSLDEVRKFRNAPRDLFSTLFHGGYPAVFDRRVPPTEWLANYVRTYVERDVRQVLKVGDLLAFQTFLGLCAGHAGQMLNLSALGAAAGITHNTAKAWLSVLEASYIVHRLPAWTANINKRLIKTPKLHFYDSGLLCYMLGIRSAQELVTHAKRGAIFEGWVVSELSKLHASRGVDARVSYYRDHVGQEVDLLVEQARRTVAIEIKSGQTIADDFFVGLDVFAELAGKPVERVVVYGGADSQVRTRARIVGWTDVANIALTTRPSRRRTTIRTK